jgi:hypothetical protein
MAVCAAGGARVMYRLLLLHARAYVTKTDSTTTMPVALARRAEDDTRTWARESRAANATPCSPHSTTLRAILLNSLTILCSLSASGGQTAAQHPRPGLCLIHPGWRPASQEGQPRRQVNSQHSRTKRQTVTAAMLPDIATHPDSQTQPRFMQPSIPTQEQEWESDQHNTRREAGPAGPSHRKHPEAHLTAIDGRKRRTV